MWNYYRDEPNSGTDVHNITHSIFNSESFDYKANFIKDGINQNNLLINDIKIVVPLKHLSNFWRSIFDLILVWFKNCVLISKTTIEADYGVNSVVYEIDNPKKATLQITDTKVICSSCYFLKRKW